MSWDAAETYLQKLRQKGQFAVFQLPRRTAFVQVMRTSNGSLVVEASEGGGNIELLLQRMGTVSRNELGLVTVLSEAGNDATCAEVIAQTIGVLATSSGCENVCRVRIGAQ